ncbi:MAG TPA: hypothetical protein VGA00_10780 [Acidiferrobacterales bacterium]
MKTLALRAAIGLLCSLPALALAAGTLALPKTAPYHKDLDVRENIKTECKLDQNLMQFVETYAKQNFDKIVMVDKVGPKTKGQALAVTIMHVEAVGGGPWSGKKSVTVEGTLYNNGKAVGNFRGMRQTKGGYKTCANLNHIAKSLGKDIGGWLKNPVKDARLGDLK